MKALRDPMPPKLKLLAKWILLGGLALVWLLFAFIIIGGYFMSYYNRAWILSGKIETIEVTEVMWACDCADFIETKYYKNNPEYEVKEEDCIFIEAARPEVDIPESFFEKSYNEKGRINYALRLTGQFYKDKGISRTYRSKAAGGPDRARVFRYDSFKIIEK